MNDLDKLIALVNDLPDVVESTVAPKVAVALKQDIDHTISEGQTAYGQEWKLKQDGGQALRHASKAVTVTVQGTTVVMKVTGVEARHHLGAVKGKIKRAILPDVKGLLSNKMYRDIQKIATDAIQEHMKNA